MDMDPQLHVRIIGDFQPDHFSHIATNETLTHASAGLSAKHKVTWLPTGSLGTGRIEEILEPFDGLWCAPKSPYVSQEGAIKGIRFAREMGCPFFAT